MHVVDGVIAGVAVHLGGERCADDQMIACFQRSSTTKDPGFDTTSASAQLVRAKGQDR
jgi:hypothetical protein